MARGGKSRNNTEELMEEFHGQGRRGGEPEAVAGPVSIPGAQSGDAMAAQDAGRSRKPHDRPQPKRTFECRVVKEVAALLHNLCKSDLQTIRRYEEHHHRHGPSRDQPAGQLD